jgi:SAM-dependent methyltransferase
MPASHLQLAHLLWEQILVPGDNVIDATCGNGHDTYFLAKLLQGRGSLLGYDIQARAIEKTEERLKNLNEEERAIVSLHLASHEELPPILVKLIVYNLGYLPGADHQITTRLETTLASLERASALLVPGGALSVTCYPGHSEGKKESDALIDFFTSLPHARWSVSLHRWIQRGARAPFLIFAQHSTPPP